MKLLYLFVLGLLLLVTVDTALTERRRGDQSPVADHVKWDSRLRSIRIHRQAAEDSYEDGAEYEYEEEENGKEAEAEVEKPTPTKEGEGEEYYDGENYDEKNEETEPSPTQPPTTTTSTTTTTTTTPEPSSHTSMEHIEDEDHYEERYEEERRRYEQETLRQQYENTHGTESVEESPEERGRNPEEHDITHEESDTEDHEESPETTTTPPEPPTTTVEEPEETEEITESKPIEKVDEGESETEKVEDIDASNRESVESTKSVEIDETGRQDLERYSVPGAHDNSSESHKDEDEEYNEVEENGENEQVFDVETTTTTTSKPVTVEEDIFERKRDPYEYEVEQPIPNNNNVGEEEEYYEEKESEESPPTPSTTTTTAATTTTIATTTTTPLPPQSSIENEITSEEENNGYGYKPYDDRERYDDRVPESSYNPTEPDNENKVVSSKEKSETYDEEEEEEPVATTTIPTTTTTTETPTTTTPPPTTTTTTTTTYRPYDPDEYEEEEDEDEEDGYGIFTTSTTTTTTETPTTTTKVVSIGSIEEADSLENQVFEESREQINNARNQYEISPTVELPKERVIIAEIIPKIECFAGYRLSDDGQECVDENECENDACGPLQICHNLPGSYKCSCPFGQIVDPRNAKNCRDFNECQIGNGGCDQDCINVVGSFYCACADDFDLGPEGKRCIRKPTTTTTTTTTTTPPPTTTSTTTTTTTQPPSPPSTTQSPVFIPTSAPVNIPSVSSTPFSTATFGEDYSIKNCPTPPVPRGSGIAYLYCSRSPVGIHHRHSQLERRLLHDWAARRNKTQLQGGRNSLRYRSRRTLLKRKLRQTTYSPGSLCELRCRPGFELKGQYTLQCNSSDGTWHGTRNGFCQATPKTDSQLPGVGLSESTPSNEIPRLPPNEVSGFNNQFKPSFVNLPNQSISSSATFRPTYYQPPAPAPTRPFRPVPTTPSTTTTTSTTPPTTTTTSTTTTTTTERPTTYWSKPQLPTRRPYYYSPSTTYANIYNRPVTPSYSPVTPSQTTTFPTTTTSRNSYIHLTYRFKTPWIKCPEDIKLDLPPNQNTAYVIIPQPQTNVDWWRQVTAEPSWAKGLESESGPGKQRITFRARTAASMNNSAECSFTLEVKDNEAPRVRECPESFSSRLSQGQNAKPVQWIEPHFSDNVKITALKKSHEPGAVLSIGEHLINYEAKDSSDNKARCSFTVTVLPPVTSNQNYFHRRPVNTEGITTTTTSSPSAVKPEVHSAMRNVVCYVGKKGRRIVFQSRLVPRGCSEMTVDIAGDAAGQGSFDTMNTITQNSAENSATSQISSVSFSTHDHPQQASAFSQSVSNGRNSNRLVHSTSSVTNGEHGTSSKSSSYAIAVSSASRNFDLPFLNPDKQFYEEDFVVPTQAPTPMIKTRAGQTREETGGYRYGSAPPNSFNSKNNSEAYRKYFRHFDTWDTTTDPSAYRN